MTILLPRLRDLGHDVELLTFDGTRTPFTDLLEHSGIKVHSLNATNVYSPANILRLRRFLCRYDIIHTHNTACQMFVPLARLFVCGRRPRLVTTEHNTTNRRRNSRLFRIMDRWMYGRYSRIVCIGETTERNLLDHIGKPLPTIVIHNGIEIPTPSAVLSSLEGDIIVSMVAAFRPQKNQDCAVRAMTHLPQRFKLRLIGDGERRAEVEQLARQLDVADRVTFLGNRSDVNRLLSESHINLLSSHWEGLSLSSLECMASAKPFIASDVPGLHEIVCGFGVLFTDDNDQALAQAVEELVADSARYAEVSAACRRRALDFDITATARRYSAVYGDIAASH